MVANIQDGCQNPRGRQILKWLPKSKTIATTQDGNLVYNLEK